MTIAEPFIQGKAHELKQIVPMLRGCFAQVYLLIGAYEVDPLGLTFSEICELTGLSKPSVSAAIKFLSRNNIITSQREENAIRYHACFGFYFRGSPVNLRGEAEVRNFLTSHDMNDDVLHEVHVEKSFIHDMTETRKILSAAGIQGKNLESLAETVAPEIAETWATWIENVPRERWRNPEGYVVKQLAANPQQRAPFVKMEAPRVQRPVLTGKLAYLQAEKSVK